MMFSDFGGKRGSDALMHLIKAPSDECHQYCLRGEGGDFLRF